MSDLQVNILGYSQLGSYASEFEQALEFDVRTILRNKKSIKFMAKQDKMAVIAATNAFNMAGINGHSAGGNTGLYFAIGHIPFEQAPLDVLVEKSVIDNEFSMQQFSTQAAHALNPLLTFKCLPNMPVFHVSYNLNITGGYYVTYPGAGQWFQALQKAMIDLESQRVEYAIVGAVADQLNPVVKHHVRRTQAASVERLIDSACVLVLSKNSSKSAVGHISDVGLAYRANDILTTPPDIRNLNRAMNALDAGVVDPALYIAQILDQQQSTYKKQSATEQSISINTIDGISANLKLSLP